MLNQNVKRAILLVFISIPLNLFGQAIIADHTIVDDYDIIPQQYIDSVKKMWTVLAGESHSGGYRIGAELLEAQDTRFQVSTVDWGEPEPASEANLRLSRGTWGDVNQSSGWVYHYGEEDWFTSDLAVSRTRAGITYCNTNGFEIDAMGFGWCWDMNWTAPAGDIDPVFQTRWGGSTDGGPDGDRVWGLDAGDYALTGNSVNMDTYLNVTYGYQQLCESSGYKTKIFFTTGPVDNTYNYNEEEQGYQRFLKMEYIREFVSNHDDTYLFDYADILCYNNAGEHSTTTWEDYGGVVREYEIIHPDNMLDLDGGFEYDGDHIGQVGTVRIAKALWWMLARMAGWNGLPEGSEDTEAPSVPQNLVATVLDTTSVDLTWSASTDNVGVTGYNIYRNSSLLTSTASTSYTDINLEGSSTYTYSVSAYDAAGNQSSQTSGVDINIYDTLNLSDMTFGLVTGYNWLSINVNSDDMSLANLFSDLHTTGDYIKNQTQSATYYDGFGWFGTLSIMNPQQLYMMKLSADADITITGNRIDPTSSGIVIYSGWNWIGFIPRVPISVGEALASLNLTHLDYIKDQTSSATYYDGTGWFGSLTELQPGNGYMIRISNAGTLTYPESGTVQGGKKSIASSDLENTYVRPYNYEFNATLTASVVLDDDLIPSDEDMLFAYSADTCRGVQTRILFDPTSNYLFPMMVYSNLASGEELRFVYYHAATDTYLNTAKTIEFVKDSIYADAYSPLELNFKSAGTMNTPAGFQDYKFSCYPNPAKDNLSIEFELIMNDKVTVELLDITGRVLDVVANEIMQPGTYREEVDISNLGAGIFFIKFQQGAYIRQEKIIHID